MAEDTTTEAERLNEEASLWHARLESGAADIHAFNAWRDADPRHSLAFARIVAAAGAIDDLGGYDFEDDPDLRTGSGKRRQFLRIGVGAAVIAACAGGWAVSQRRASAATKIGERQLVQLPDRVGLELNTDTRVEWKRAEGSLKLWLIRGEIAVSVPFGQKPCVLQAGSSTVEIAGDVNVRLRISALDLTVLRGSCLVNEGSAEKPLRVQAKQSILTGVGATRVREITGESIERTRAWRDDAMVFDGQTLGFAVEEYNRYLTRRIVIIDPEIAAIIVGGRFSSRDPESFLKMAESSFGIRVLTGPNGEHLLTRAGHVS